MFKNLCFLLSIVVLCVTLSLSAEIEYDVVVLAPEGLETVTETKACELSESGYVVGSILDFPDTPAEKGFVYHPDDGFKIIPGLFEHGDLTPYHVNDEGVVTGYVNHYAWEFTEYGGASCWCIGGPFIYDAKSEAFTALKNIEGSVEGISNTGQLLVIDTSNWEDGWKGYLYDIESGEISREFKTEWNGDIFMNNLGDFIADSKFYTPGEEPIDLGSLDPYGRWPVEAAVLSDTGFVAGVGRDVQKDKKGFIWDKVNGFRQFNTLGTQTINIHGMNNLGDVVGSSKRPDGPKHAFLFHEKVGTVDLDTLGGKESRAFDINDTLQIVGTADAKSSVLGRRAFIWDPVNGMRDLNDLIPPNTGWKKLYKAEKINNMGHIIGRGIYLGQEHAFMLIPRN